MSQVRAGSASRSTPHPLTEVFTVISICGFIPSAYTCTHSRVLKLVSLAVLCVRGGFSYSVRGGPGGCTGAASAQFIRTAEEPSWAQSSWSARRRLVLHSMLCCRPCRRHHHHGRSIWQDHRWMASACWWPASFNRSHPHGHFLIQQLQKCQQVLQRCQHAVPTAANGFLNSSACMRRSCLGLACCRVHREGAQGALRDFRRSVLPSPLPSALDGGGLGGRSTTGFLIGKAIPQSTTSARRHGASLPCCTRAAHTLTCTPSFTY